MAPTGISRLFSRLGGHSRHQKRTPVRSTSPDATANSASQGLQTNFPTVPQSQSPSLVTKSHNSSNERFDFLVRPSIGTSELRTSDIDSSPALQASHDRSILAAGDPATWSQEDSHKARIFVPLSPKTASKDHPSRDTSAQTQIPEIFVQAPDMERDPDNLRRAIVYPLPSMKPGKDTNSPEHVLSLPGDETTNDENDAIVVSEPFPLEAICDVTISFESKILANINYKICWYQKKEYEDLRMSTKSILIDKLPNYLKDHKLYFNYGTCAVRSIRGTEAILSFDLENLLAAKAIKQIVGFIHYHTYKAFRLHVFCDYGSAQVKPWPTESYQEMLTRELDRKMRLNFREQEYISWGDLVPFRSFDFINRFVERDEERYVRDLTSEDRTQLSERIALEGPVLFLICVFAGLPLQYLNHLLQERFTDEYQPDDTHECEDTTCRWKIRRFTKQKANFLAYKFKESLSHRNIPKDVVIPIQFDRKKDMLGIGSFSEVFRVNINPQHHDLSSDRSAPFALKIFRDRPNIHDAFFKEQQLLQELARFPHDHLVSHLSSWDQGDRYYILYPLARCNLRRFMETTECLKMSAKNVLWFLRQLEGLAGAVRHIHYLGGTLPLPGSGLDLFTKSIGHRTAFHHDLKPENILVFEELEHKHGQLKISDFGTAAMHYRRPNAGSDSEMFARGTLTYQAPDIAVNGRASRPYDIWALGCVFLEFVSWVALPYKEAIEDFADARMEANDSFASDDAFWTYNIISKEYRLRPAVARRLEYLKLEYFRGVRAFEAVVDIITRMLDVKPQKRIDVRSLCSDLEAVLLQTTSDLDAFPDLYLRTPTSTVPQDGVHPLQSSNFRNGGDSAHAEEVARVPQSQSPGRRSLDSRALKVETHGRNTTPRDTTVLRDTRFPSVKIDFQDHLRPTRRLSI